jgi:hypothetical protein
MYYSGKIYDAVEFRDKVFTSIKLGKGYNCAADSFDEIRFITDSGRKYLMYHNQDCCEWVHIYDIKGDINSLLNNKIIYASQQILECPHSTDNWPEDVNIPKYLESYAWTIYTLKTEKDTVIIRWLGESNGYYSESVDIIDIE